MLSSTSLAESIFHVLSLLVAVFVNAHEYSTTCQDSVAGGDVGTFRDNPEDQITPFWNHGSDWQTWVIGIVCARTHGLMVENVPMNVSSSTFWSKIISWGFQHIPALQLHMYFSFGCWYPVEHGKASIFLGELLPLAFWSFRDPAYETIMFSVASSCLNIYPDSSPSRSTVHSASRLVKWPYKIIPSSN